MLGYLTGLKPPQNGNSSANFGFAELNAVIDKLGLTKVSIRFCGKYMWIYSPYSACWRQKQWKFLARGWDNFERMRRMVNFYRARIWTQKQLAENVGCSIRTVQRVIKACTYKTNFKRRKIKMTGPETKKWIEEGVKML